MSKNIVSGCVNRGRRPDTEFMQPTVGQTQLNSPSRVIVRGIEAAAVRVAVIPVLGRKQSAVVTREGVAGVPLEIFLRILNRGL